MKLAKVFILTVLLGGTVFAQQGVFSGITWNIGFPAGHTHDLLTNTSFRGIGLDFLRYVSPDVSIGGSFSWNGFDELRRNETFQLESGAVTGTQVRQINAFPLLAIVRYDIGEKRGEMHPFIGLGAGAYSFNQRLEIGISAFSKNTWHFGIAPEVGFRIPTGRNTFLTAAVRWNLAFDSGTSLSGQDENSQSYWGLNIGFGTIQGWF